MGLAQLLQLLLLILTSTFCLNSLSLLSSMSAAKRKRESGNVALLLLLVFLFMPMLSVIGVLRDSHWGQDEFVPFYGLRIPLLLFLSLAALYVGIWSYRGIIRKFITEKRMSFSHVLAPCCSFWAVS